MSRCKQLEQYSPDLFVKFIKSGKLMVDAAIEGDCEKVKKLFAQAMDKEIMYWHVTKALKEAIRH